jgi:hypothetical protein
MLQVYSEIPGTFSYLPKMSCLKRKDATERLVKFAEDLKVRAGKRRRRRMALDAGY